MDEYTKLMEKIKTYFELEDVEYTESVISAYDLFQILTEKFMILHDVIYADTFEQQINNYLLSDNLAKRFLKKVFKVKAKSVRYIISNFTEGTSTVSIRMTDGTYNSTTICKDLNNEQLYFTERQEGTSEIIQEFISDIERHLHVLEEFYKLISLSNSSITSIPNNNGKFEFQTFSDGFLNISIGYNTYGSVRYQISVDEKADPSSLFKKEWLNLECIHDYVSQNAETLLRKVPINVSELNETSKAIIKEYNNKRKDNKMLINN